MVKETESATPRELQLNDPMIQNIKPTSSSKQSTVSASPRTSRGDLKISPPLTPTIPTTATTGTQELPQEQPQTLTSDSLVNVRLTRQKIQDIHKNGRKIF